MLTQATLPAEIPKVLEAVVTAVVHSLDKQRSQDLHIATSTAKLGKRLLFKITTEVSFLSKYKGNSVFFPNVSLEVGALYL